MANTCCCVFIYFLICMMIVMILHFLIDLERNCNTMYNGSLSSDFCILHCGKNKEQFYLIHVYLEIWHALLYQRAFFIARRWMIYACLAYIRLATVITIVTLWKLAWLGITCSIFFVCSSSVILGVSVQ